MSIKIEKQQRTSPHFQLWEDVLSVYFFKTKNIDETLNSTLFARQYSRKASLLRILLKTPPTTTNLETTGIRYWKEL